MLKAGKLKFRQDNLEILLNVALTKIKPALQHPDVKKKADVEMGVVTKTLNFAEFIEDQKVRCQMGRDKPMLLKNMAL